MLRFHGNRFHNTVAAESDCGAAAYVFFDKVAATQKGKPRGDTERKKRDGVAEGDKRMSDLG